MSYFCKGGRSLPDQGSLAGVKRELTAVEKGSDAKWKDEEEEPRRQVNGAAADISPTVCREENSSKRSDYHLVFT